ncbi:protein translocase subunit SecD [Neptunicella marina]|uniref:Protein translocase subunit SecD n=1 Tax=Neptunicella marina TaxID=2125989 RepID=A0A8J6LVQ2_9ALTE|nr:protein translocase subunit SecD [Neptunicella marina]
MLNKTPMWKYLMVFFVLAVGALYALPNIFGEDHAVQISAGRNTTVTTQTLQTVEQSLVDARIDTKRVTMENQQILVRVKDSESQLMAKEVLEKQLGGDYYVAMNLAPDTPSWLASIGGEPIKLGLDLRGGVHFLMEVDMNLAMSKALEDTVTSFRTNLREEKIRYRGVRQLDDSVEVQFRDQETLDQGLSYLKSRNPDWLFEEEDNLVVSAKMSQQKVLAIRDYAVKQNITIMRNRVNQLGVAEPLIQRQGADRIVVQLPGIQDTARAKEILNATATLDFRLLDTEHDVQAAVAGRIPPGADLVKDQKGVPYLLQKKVMMSGNHIIDAASSLDEYGRPQVNISVDSEGGNKMSLGTKGNIGKPMATVFIEYKPLAERDKNDKPIFEKVEQIISVATIQSRLGGGGFRITGVGSPQEAQNLALLLRAGALIAPIQIVEERTVGPSLGQENIDLGMQAIIWGFVLVLAFMAMYYRGFGLVANFALAANLVLIVGVMSLIPGATLTLPGMAGIVLTVGMAVDANVLIFERIREEMRDGRGPQQSIHQGYDSAFSTILDANITTLIAAIILFAIGTGPIKGFSVTLAIGIITSMFTAIVVTRVIVNAVWGGKRIDKLSI